MKILNRKKTVSPTGSYYLDVPANALVEIDGAVTSYWMPDDNRSLQISSYARSEGKQVSSRDRLSARLEREGRAGVSMVDIGIGGADSAAYKFVDQHGIEWMYLYIVWPDLTVFATLSGPVGSISSEDSWILSAARSFRRRL